MEQVEEKAAGARIALPTDRMTRAKSVSGGVSFHCGDRVARDLQGMPLNLVAELAQGVIDVDMSKYAHLNVGQQRMTLGNLIRNALRRDEGLTGTYDFILGEVKVKWDEIKAADEAAAEAAKAEKEATREAEKAEKEAAKAAAKADREAAKAEKEAAREAAKAEKEAAKAEKEAAKEAKAAEKEAAKADREAAREAAKAEKEAAKEAKRAAALAEKQRKADERAEAARQRAAAKQAEKDANHPHAHLVVEEE